MVDRGARVGSGSVVVKVLRFPTTCAKAASITSRGWSVFRCSRILVTVLFPADAGMNRSKKTGSPNGRGMIDDFRLWGSRRCRRIGETANT